MTREEINDRIDDLLAALICDGSKEKRREMVVEIRELREMLEETK